MTHCFIFLFLHTHFRWSICVFKTNFERLFLIKLDSVLNCFPNIYCMSNTASAVSPVVSTHSKHKCKKHTFVFHSGSLLLGLLIPINSEQQNRLRGLFFLQNATAGLIQVCLHINSSNTLISRGIWLFITAIYASHFPF